ncbi:hypothetical protein F5Y09DRAFT_323836 [Xylaria sp. FL1042]|nr:hypothetical protein F5Y09DRAFT_323836 [Xylaria sp. FL1042]
MPRNKKPRKEDVVVDESLLDPRLRSSPAKTHENVLKTHASALGYVPGPIPSSTSALTSAPASGPGPESAPLFPWNDPWWDTFEDDICDDKSAFPESSFKSLDHIIDAEGPSMRDDERYWLMGMQTGIGLGIFSAREAIMNEMQNYNSIFGRQLQRNPSDPDPITMRMRLGKDCQTGFDRRVAYRAANRYDRSRNQLADMVVHNGLTECLPGTGDHMIGTSMLFSKEDVVRCHENAQLIRDTFGTADNQQQQPSLLTSNGSGAELLASPTASFMGDGLTIAGVDMTKLSGTAAVVANACKFGAGGTGIGPSCIRNRHPMTEGPGPTPLPAPTPHVSHPTHNANPVGHSRKNGAKFKVR